MKQPTKAELKATIAKLQKTTNEWADWADRIHNISFCHYCAPKFEAADNGTEYDEE
jgi:hypothetical protein